jgi:hypothetical protein
MRCSTPQKRSDKAGSTLALLAHHCSGLDELVHILTSFSAVLRTGPTIQADVEKIVFEWDTLSISAPILLSINS